LQAKATKILHRNNAQEILQALATLEEHQAEIHDALCLTNVGGRTRYAPQGPPS
jgi:hypothetical protein